MKTTQLELFVPYRPDPALSGPTRGQYQHMTVPQARRALAEHLKTGQPSTCPCCDQRVRLYKRNLYSAPAWCLVIVVREYLETGGWVDVKDVVRRIVGQDSGPDKRRSAYPTSDFAKLRYWELIRARDDAEPHQRTSGLWKPTDKGIGFAAGRVKVPRSAYIYNAQCYGFDAEMVSIHDCLDDRFDYDELVHASGPLSDLLLPPT